MHFHGRKTIKVADLEELISNLGDDLKTMAGRDDKTIHFLDSGNEVRLEFHKILAECGVVDLGATPTTGTIYTTLLI